MRGWLFPMGEGRAISRPFCGTCPARGEPGLWEARQARVHSGSGRSGGGGWGWGTRKEELRTRQVGERGSHCDPQRRGTPGICGRRAGGGRGWRFGSQPSRRPTFLQDHFPLLNAGYSPCCAEVAATSSPWTSAPGFRFPSSSARGEAFLLLPGFGQFILKLREPTEPV